MRYSKELAACLLLLPALSSCVEPGGNGPDASKQSPPMITTTPISPLTTLSTTSLVTPTASGVSTMDPLATASSPGPAPMGFLLSDFLSVMIGTRKYKFTIDINGSDTFLFTQNICSQGDSDPSSSQGPDCGSFAVPGDLPASDQDSHDKLPHNFSSWELNGSFRHLDMSFGTIASPINTNVLLVNSINPSSSLGNFTEYFQGIGGILGLGVGSELAASLQTKLNVPAGFSIAGDLANLDGTIVFGGISASESSINSSQIFKGSTNIPVVGIELARNISGSSKTAPKNKFIATVDPSCPFLALPDSVLENIPEIEPGPGQLQYKLSPKSLDPESLPEITLRFAGRLNITLSKQHYQTPNGLAIQKAPDGQITLGWPFLRAAYIGVEGVETIAMGPASPGNSVRAESFDVVNKQIEAQSSQSSTFGEPFPTLTPVSTGSHGSSRKANVGAIVGGVIGSLALLSIAAFLFLCCRRRRRRTSGYGGRKRGMSKEFPEEDEMTRGINHPTNSFGSQAPSGAHDSTYAPVPPPPPGLSPPELEQVKTEADVATYEPSPATPGSMAAMGGVIGTASAHNTQPNSVASSPHESKRFSGFSGISRKPVPQRASRQVDLDSDDEVDAASVRSPASELRAASPTGNENRSSYQLREVPRLPFNRGPSDGPAF